MYRKSLPLFGLVFALLVPSAAAQAPPEAKRLDVTVKDVDATLENSWFGIYAHGKKIGFQNVAVEKVTEKGQTFYRTHERVRLKLVALGTKGELNFEQSLVFAGQAPFALLSGEYMIDDGNSRKRISLVAKGKGYEATVTVGKVTQKATLNDLDFTLADAVSSAVWLKKGPAKGETITVAEFDFEDLRMAKTSTKLHDTKEIVHDGARSLVNELEKITYRARSRETSTVRRDSDGFMVSGLLGGLFEIRKESESDAKKTEFPEDLLFAGMVKLDRPIFRVKGLTLKGKGEVYGLLPETALQKIIRVGDDHYLVKLGKHHGTKLKATEQEIKEALEETARHPIHDAKVLELARKAIGDARTDQEKVNRLCKFVHEYIKYQIVYDPKVHDILERKVGDCKSYALLFTCLARAVGLPAHEAGGYAYMGDDLKGFGGHAWNEVVIDGHWVPVDATEGRTDLAPLYICVSTGRNMSGVTGTLSFQLVDVERE
jgi:hypothetical protein